MLLCPLTFNSGDAFDPVQARTVIEDYSKEWHKFDLFKVHGMEYKPSWEAVAALQEAGVLVTLCGFNRDNELKAFYIGYKSKHIYNPDWVYAHNMMFYIAPEYRSNPWVFKTFMKKLEKQMRADGVDLYSLVLPCDQRFEKAYKSIERNGFNREDITFMRRTS